MTRAYFPSGGSLALLPVNSVSQPGRKAVPGPGEQKADSEPMAPTGGNKPKLRTPGQSWTESSQSLTQPTVGTAGTGPGDSLPLTVQLLQVSHLYPLPIPGTAQGPVFLIPPSH